MDYGKFLYEKSKSSKEQKKKQKVIQVKEIKFRPGTDANLRHILTKKATKRKRHLRPKAMVSKGDLGLVIACLPYA